ncbi:hypothetical protein GEMRC1_003719 [Eukaryota sp. GEM-RC1]
MSEESDKEIYTYRSDRQIYGCAWSSSAAGPLRNDIQIVQFDNHKQDFAKAAVIQHPYPATKVMWGPPNTFASQSSSTASVEYLATSGDYLRVNKVITEDDKITTEQLCLLNGNKSSSFCAPLTSFDWNESAPNILGTSSIDTTCSIWDLNTKQLRTQLIAHDKEVFDIAFARSPDLFASVGADGSVRMFDLRALGHSTIIYETTNTPLLRLAWNKQDPNYLATIAQDSCSTIVLDIRMPSIPVVELPGHSLCVNALCWAPHSSCHISTGSDDKFTFIWDLSPLPNTVDDPMLAYGAPSPIEYLDWSTAHTDWIAITFGNQMQALRV